MVRRAQWRAGQCDLGHLNMTNILPSFIDTYQGMNPLNSSLRLHWKTQCMYSATRATTEQR
jgi:hypothetical protein